MKPTSPILGLLIMLTAVVCPADIQEVRAEQPPGQGAVCTLLDAVRPCSPAPGCGPVIAGDLNGDRKVDSADLKTLAMHWLIHEIFPPRRRLGNPDPNFYNDKLRTLILGGPKPIVPFRFYIPDSGWNEPGPDFRPMPGLDTPDAVPFLIDVLLNGPDWSDEEILTAYGGLGPHVARCYAALCVGAIGDARAFEPLVETLQNGDYMEDKYTITYPRKDDHDIRNDAAFALGLLGDCRAVEPLVASLTTEHRLSCVYALCRLWAISATRPIIEVAAEHDGIDAGIHRCLEYMLRLSFEVVRVDTDGNYAVAEFPDMPPADYRVVHERLWQYWLQNGDRYAKGQFDRYYVEWDAALVEYPGAPSRHRSLWRHMLKGGVAAIPYIIRKIEEGDDRLTEALAELTLSNCSSGRCSVLEWLQWWKQNREDWLIFGDDPTVSRALRVPEEYPTIQAAIDDANDGDLVLVAPGTYTGDGNRDIDFSGKAITVRSEGGARRCIIDCQGSEAEPHRGFYFHNAENANSVLAGVTIINGYAEWGGGILCDHADLKIGQTARDPSNPTIIGCILSHNRAARAGGGMLITDSYPQIRNCILLVNTAGERGGGILYVGNKTVCIQNCAIINNHAGDSGGGLALGAGDGAEAFLHNTILWGNRAPVGTQIARELPTPAGTAKAVLKYCCIEPGPNSAVMTYGPAIEGIFQSNHNISDDPLLLIAGNGDCHLKSQAGRWDPVSRTWVQDDVTSPCIDAGDPNSPIGHEPFPNGGRINLGAYGGAAEASKSYFGEPICETIIAGDINGDCKVDLKDFQIMALHWWGVDGEETSDEPEPPRRPTR